MNDRKIKGDRRAVENPSHYGGAEDPFETIKVLEAKLTPQEYVGFLKGNAMKYLDRHPHKDGQTDLMKAKWYQDRLLVFTARVGHEVIYPQTVYWTEAFPEPIADADDVIRQTLGGEEGLFMLNQNTAPFVHWVFAYLVGDGDDGSNLEWTIYEEESHARAAMQMLHDEKPVKLPDPEPARSSFSGGSVTGHDRPAPLFSGGTPFPPEADAAEETETHAETMARLEAGE